jgi:hypothetical protein
MLLSPKLATRPLLTAPGQRSVCHNRSQSGN